MSATTTETMSCERRPLSEGGGASYTFTLLEIGFLTSPGVRRTPGTLQSTDQILGGAVGAGTGVALLVRLVESSRSISTS